MAKRRLWASAPLFLFFLAPAFAFEPDFSFYPTNAQSCLSSAATASQCSGSTSQDLNQCFCSNGGNFVLSTAACVGKNDPADVQKVFSTMSSACSFSNTTLTVSESQFILAANNAASSTMPSPTTSATATATTATTAVSSSSSASTVTVTPTSTDASDSQKSEALSTGASVGIAVGASVGGVAAIAGLTIFLLRRQKKRGEESHPMLPQFGQDSRYSGATTFPPTEPSPGFSPFVSETKPPAWASPTPSPDPSYASYRTSGMTWDSTQGPYKGPYASPDGVVELPPETASHGSHIFEMDGTGTVHHHGPAEMQGSLPPRGGYNAGV